MNTRNEAMKKYIHEKVAKALVMDSKNQVLILFRSSTHPRFAHQPDLPGGIVEAGEDFLLALNREVNEELSIDVPIERFIELYKKVRYTERPGKKYKTIDALYRVKIPDFHPDKIKLSWEHERFAIMPMNDLLKMDLPENLDGYMKNVVRFLSKLTIQ